MLKIEIITRDFQFAFPAGTSRGVLTHKKSWFLCVTDDERPGITGIGECSPIWGLSPESEESILNKLTEVCKRAGQFDFFLRTGLLEFPSIRFALETAVIDFLHGGTKILFSSAFTNGEQGIPVNGLVWMNEPKKMLEDARKKINDGFACIKLKIGTHDWKDEEWVLSEIRHEFGNSVELRVDANGAYTVDSALRVMESCARLNVHSIEQPLKPGNYGDMRRLVVAKTTAVALDEELIGLITEKQRLAVFEEINPPFIVLKPSLLGGLTAVREWIELAKKHKCGWWITSMLESNIGLNAIAQFTATLNVSIPQGLGTGRIYTNNISSPLHIKGQQLFYEPGGAWQNLKEP